MEHLNTRVKRLLGGMICNICSLEDPQKWLEEYYMRSISETVNSIVKCRFGAHAWGNGLIRRMLN